MTASALCRQPPGSRYTCPTDHSVAGTWCAHDMQCLTLVVWLQDEAVTMVEEAEELTDALRTQVLFAREYLKSVTIGPKQVRCKPL